MVLSAVEELIELQQTMGVGMENTGLSILTPRV